MSSRQTENDIVRLAGRHRELNCMPKSRGECTEKGEMETLESRICLRDYVSELFTEWL